MNRIRAILTCCLFPAAVLAQHPNVKISNIADPNEPAIALDPANPARIVAGSNIANVYFSADTGHTWMHQFLNSDYGVWGDPVIGVDNQGDFLFLHLSNPPNSGWEGWIDRIVCQKSTDGGQTWSPGTFMGLNGAKDQDKHWIAIDPVSNIYYVTWTEFDAYGSSSPQDSSRILFSKSMDSGQTWSPAKRINKTNGDCIDSDNTVEGAVPCIGPNGEVYVAWAGPEGLRFDRSLDGGNNWLNDDIKISDFPGGWDYEIPGVYRCNGLPVTACDCSYSPNRGTIYVNWTDQRNGPDDTDVWLAKSADGGQTWSDPIRVNNDPAGRQQFLTWMTIDQTNGWLWFVFYDRRNYSDKTTDVYMAVSRDGGATFQNFKVSESPFTPNEGQFLGDYNNITAHNNIVRPIWTRMDGLATSIWTALVNTAVVNASGTKDQSAAPLLDVSQNFPNPAETETWIPFKIRRKTTVTLQIAGADGKVLHTVFENKPFDYGKYTERVPLKDLHLPAGHYWILLSSERKVMSKRMAVVKP